MQPHHLLDTLSVAVDPAQGKEEEEHNLTVITL